MFCKCFILYVTTVLVPIPLHGLRLRSPPTDELTTILQLVVQQIHHQRTKICHISTSWHVEMLGSGIAMWQICCRIVMSSSVGGVVQHVRSRCPCSGVWALQVRRNEWWCSFEMENDYVALLRRYSLVIRSVVFTQIDWHTCSETRTICCRHRKRSTLKTRQMWHALHGKARQTRLWEVSEHASALSRGMYTSVRWNSSTRGRAIKAVVATRR